jgi:hypothetical protein
VTACTLTPIWQFPTFPSARVPQLMWVLGHGRG